MLRRRHLLAVAGLAAPPLAHGQAAAWAPSRPLRLVVPFPAGGATDVAARILAERLTETLGQPVVVENRTGSSGNIGMENVVRSAPDGHSLLMGTSGALTVNPHLFPNLGFDPAKDLAPVSLAFTTDNALIVNPNMPARTVAEFLALARSRPGRSATARPAPAPPPTWRRSCSGWPPASRCCTCPTAAARRR